MLRLIAALSSAPTAAKEEMFTPFLMSFIISLTSSSVLYCFKVTIWEIQWGDFSPLSLSISYILSVALQYSKTFNKVQYSIMNEFCGYTQSSTQTYFWQNLFSAVRCSWYNTKQQWLFFSL